MVRSINIFQLSKFIYTYIYIYNNNNNSSTTVSQDVQANPIFCAIGIR